MLVNHVHQDCCRKDEKQEIIFSGRCETTHQVSTHGRFLPSRGVGGGAERNALRIQWRESTGSITSSISKCDAMLMPLPCWYSFATIWSKSALRAAGSSTASSSLRYPNF